MWGMSAQPRQGRASVTEGRNTEWHGRALSLSFLAFSLSRFLARFLAELSLSLTGFPMLNCSLPLPLPLPLRSLCSLPVYPSTFAAVCWPSSIFLFSLFPFPTTAPSLLRSSLLSTTTSIGFVDPRRLKAKEAKRQKRQKGQPPFVFFLFLFLLSFFFFGKEE